MKPTIEHLSKDFQNISVTNLQVKFHVNTCMSLNFASQITKAFWYLIKFAAPSTTRSCKMPAKQYSCCTSTYMYDDCKRVTSVINSKENEKLGILGPLYSTLYYVCSQHVSTQKTAPTWWTQTCNKSCSFL